MCGKTLLRFKDRIPIFIGILATLYERKVSNETAWNLILLKWKGSLIQSMEDPLVILTL